MRYFDFSKSIHGFIEEKVKEIIEEESKIVADKVQERIKEIVSQVAVKVSLWEDMPTMTSRLEIKLCLPDQNPIII